jgi:endonuclease-3
MKRMSPAALHGVCDALKHEYPPGDLGNKKNPLDEFLYILLSRRTHERGYRTAYKRFKQRFPRWRMLQAASLEDVVEAIRPAGLARQKAIHILNAVKWIRDRFGEISLRKLQGMTQIEVERILLTLPGIGHKSARCIMMYSLGFQVLPADTHVCRIARRLGWSAARSSYRVHRDLEDLVPPERRYDFHVACIKHGRAVCRGKEPNCRDCCLFRWCERRDVEEPGRGLRSR